MNRTPDTPYRLLWVAGAAAFLLCIAAFLLWGLGGAGMLFDMIVAFCTWRYFTLARRALDFGEINKCAIAAFLSDAVN